MCSVVDQRRLAERAAPSDLDRSAALDQAMRREDRSLPDHDPATTADLALEPVPEVDTRPHDQRAIVRNVEMKPRSDAKRPLELDPAMQVRRPSEQHLAPSPETRAEAVAKMPGHSAPVATPRHLGQATGPPVPTARLRTGESRC